MKPMVVFAIMILLNIVLSMVACINGVMLWTVWAGGAMWARVVDLLELVSRRGWCEVFALKAGICRRQRNGKSCLLRPVENILRA